MHLPELYSYHHFNEISSTNDHAKHQAVLDGVDRSVYHADVQTAGRGRHGNEWLSSEGNLYASVLLKPKNMTSLQAGQMSFVVALAVYDTLREFIPSNVPMGLKWPNDILVNGGKICGVLLESAFRPDQTVDWLVLGIGVNLCHKPDLDIAVTLSEFTDAPVSVDMFLPRFIRHFESLYQLFMDRGFDSIRHEWLKNAMRIGQMIRIRLPNESFDALFETIDERGQMIATTDEGTTRVIAAGDIFF